MKRLHWIPMVGSLALLAGACGDEKQDDDPVPTAGASVSLSGISDSAASGTDGDSNSGVDDDDSGGDKLDVGSGPTGGQTGCGNGDLGCTDKIDLLFVIDNSGTMAVEQENLARNFPLLIRQLENLEDSNGEAVDPDVQIMVTTSDFGNPLCTPFEPEGYEPARGAPVSDSCTDRIERFTGLGTTPDVVPEACNNVCPTAVAPEGDPFVAFNAGGDNIPDSVMPADVDGDGMDDSPVAQALACIGPQGIDGCGYESPLENMLQALDPGKPWNMGERRFLRPDALLAIALVTDEADCSVKDFTIMENEMFQEIDPDSMNKTATSAICFNAGVSCEGPDAAGSYSNCTSTNDDALQPTSRYTDYLINQLRGNQKKEVVMLGILGVPEVTEHNPDPPFEPIAGGVLDLEYRNWRDGRYDGTPGGGDILGPEFDSGTTAAHKQADFGIGPGCTGGTEATGFTGQAIPPVRIKEVCEDLNIVNDDGSIDVRCCIESICDDDFSDAINCLAGIIGEAIVVPG